jgi:hypothetical protein
MRHSRVLDNDVQVRVGGAWYRPPAFPMVTVF